MISQGVVKILQRRLWQRPPQGLQDPMFRIGIEGKDGGEMGPGLFKQLQAIGLGRRESLLVGLDGPAAQGLQPHQGRQALAGVLLPLDLEVGLPIIKGRLRVPHQHLFPLPLPEQGGGPGVAVLQPIVPGQGLGQNQVDHVIGIPGRENLALGRLDHIIGRRHHLGQIRHLGGIIMQTPEGGD